MTSEVCPHVIGLHEAACIRLPHVETHAMPMPGGGTQVCVALPMSYAKKRRRKYPLVVVLDATGLVGSAIEMSRMMAETGEIREAVLVCVEGPQARSADAELSAWLTDVLIPRCTRRYRIAREDGLLAGRTQTVASLGVAIGEAGRSRLAVRPLAGTHPAAWTASLVGQLRSFLGTGVPYGRKAVPMRHAAVMHLLTACSPLLARRSEAPPSTAPESPYLFRSKSLDRDFEVFVSLPASWKAGSGRRYPALVVLDANIAFSTVAEMAASLAQAGEIAELVVIGVGVPRSEGPLRFGMRRFEEFSPPADGYTFDDELGRIFRSLFAICGQDARDRMGRAPEFLAFLSNELLPRFEKTLSLDPEDAGIFGHSAGGTFAAFALAQPRSPFRNYIAVSPGIGIAGSWLMRQPITPPYFTGRPVQVFASIGGLEPTNAFNRIAGIHDTEAYAARLKGLSNVRVRTRCLEEETHSSTLPRAVAAALTAIYPAPAPGMAGSTESSASSCATT